MEGEQAQTDTELRQLMSKIQEGLSEIQISKARSDIGDVDD
jgi:hypothetical protein